MADPSNDSRRYPATELTLPSGGTVRLRGVETLRSGDKIDLGAWVTEVDRPLVRNFQVTTGLARLLVEQWDIPYLQGTATPLPRHQPDIMRQLEIADYDRLAEEIDPVITVLYPPPATPDNAEPGSPTGPATA